MALQKLAQCFTSRKWRFLLALVATTYAGLLTATFVWGRIHVEQKVLSPLLPPARPRPDLRIETDLPDCIRAWLREHHRGNLAVVRMTSPPDPFPSSYPTWWARTKITPIPLVVHCWQGWIADFAVGGARESYYLWFFGFSIELITVRQSVT